MGLFRKFIEILLVFCLVISINIAAGVNNKQTTNCDKLCYEPLKKDYQAFLEKKANLEPIIQKAVENLHLLIEQTKIVNSAIQDGLNKTKEAENELVDISKTDKNNQKYLLEMFEKLTNLQTCQDVEDFAKKVEELYTDFTIFTKDLEKVDVGKVNKEVEQVNNKARKNFEKFNNLHFPACEVDNSADKIVNALMDNKNILEQLFNKSRNVFRSELARINNDVENLEKKAVELDKKINEAEKNVTMIKTRFEELIKRIKNENEDVDNLNLLILEYMRILDTLPISYEKRKIVEEKIEENRELIRLVQQAQELVQSPQVKTILAICREVNDNKDKCPSNKKQVEDRR